MMWEIFSGGQRPYGDVTNGEVEMMIRNGQLLKRPDKCPIEMYQIMLMCWNREPSKRPTFAGLMEELTSVAELVMPDQKKWKRSFSQ